MCSTSRTTSRSMPSDACQRSQAAKARTRKRHKALCSPVAFACIALFSATLVTVYLWGNERVPVPAPPGGGLRPSLVQGAVDVASVTEILPSAEDGGSAPARSIAERPPSEIVKPSEVPLTRSNVYFEPPSIERIYTRLSSLGGLSVVFSKQSERIPAVAHNPHATENTALIIPGNAALSIGGTGVNGAVGAALLRQALGHSVTYTPLKLREATARLHRRAIELALTRRRGHFVTIQDDYGNRAHPTSQIFTFLRAAEPPWNRDTVGQRAGLVLLDKLKLDYALSGNPHNRFLLYVVPPNGKAEDGDFYRAYARTIMDALLLVRAYNKRNRGGEVRRIRLPPFWTGRSAQGRTLRRIALHCLRTLRIAAGRGLTAGLTIELLDDAERSFALAAKMLEDRTLRLLWNQRMQRGSGQGTSASISQVDPSTPS